MASLALSCRHPSFVKTFKRGLFFLSALFLFTSCQTQTPIVNSITERDANEILVVLASKGIPAQKTAAPASNVGGGSAVQLWDIVVPSDKITESLSILNKAGLPRVKGTNLLDLFGTQGLVPSDLQDRIRYQEGLSEQLANTIRKIDGILDADVQVSFPKDEDSKDTITASVYVKHQGVLDNPNSLLITKIKRLVASSVPGLTVENVTVVADRALYSDSNFGQMNDSPLDQKDYVSIWSIIIAKESVGRFRAIFYTFCIIIFILACLVVWMAWKFYPIIRRMGGWQSLIKPEQIDPHTLVITEEPIVVAESNEGIDEEDER